MFISKGVSQYFIERMTGDRMVSLTEDPIPKPNIIRHYEQPTHNLSVSIMKLDTDQYYYAPIDNLEESLNLLLTKYMRLGKCTVNSLALTNALWYSMSDMWEYFPHNLTTQTLEQLILLGHYFWMESEKDNFDPAWMLEPDSGNGTHINPYYRALMYFRDYNYVCHPLISYEYKKRWRVLHYDLLLDEVDGTLIKWMNRFPDGKTFL